MIGCQLHQDPVTFYFNILVFSQGKFKIWSGQSQGISDSKICTKPVLKLQCIEFCREIKEYNMGFCSYEPPNCANINDTLTVL